MARHPVLAVAVVVAGFVVIGAATNKHVSPWELAGFIGWGAFLVVMARWHRRRWERPRRGREPYEDTRPRG